jgi:hypothetical protein
LLYATILHALAGVVAGSIFRTRTLTAILIVVAVEAVALTAFGVTGVLVWGVSNLITIQLGYFAGIFVRRAAEQFGYSIPPARMRSRQ